MSPGETQTTTHKKNDYLSNHWLCWEKFYSFQIIWGINW
jgi:hypothetical protein